LYGFGASAQQATRTFTRPAAPRKVGTVLADFSLNQQREEKNYGKHDE